MTNIEDLKAEIQALKRRIQILEDKSKPFAPPTTQELYDFVLEHEKNPGQAFKIGSDFLNYFTSVGWMVGKKKMKCWRSAMRRWIKGNSQNNIKFTKTDKINKTENDYTQAVGRLFD